MPAVADVTTLNDANGKICGLKTPQRGLGATSDDVLPASWADGRQTRSATHAAVVSTPAGQRPLITAEAATMMRCLAVGSK